MSPSGVITTFAGPATSANLSQPNDVLAAPDGSIYIADTGNGLVRRVTSSGAVTIVAGNGLQAYAGDGGPAASAALNAPTGITLDKSGNLFIADSGNNRIREVLAQAPSFSLTVPTTKLTFNAIAGGTLPAPQTLSLNASVTGLGFTTVTTAPWLTVTPSTGAIPAVLQVGVDPTTLAAGTASGSVTISAPAVGATLTISVMVNVSAAEPATLSVSPPGSCLHRAAAGLTRAANDSSIEHRRRVVILQRDDHGGRRELARHFPAKRHGFRGCACVVVGIGHAGFARRGYLCRLHRRHWRGGSSISIPVTLSIAGPSAASIVVSQNALTF